MEPSGEEEITVRLPGDVLAELRAVAKLRSHDLEDVIIAELRRSLRILSGGVSSRQRLLSGGSGLLRGMSDLLRGGSGALRSGSGALATEGSSAIHFTSPVGWEWGRARGAGLGDLGPEEGA